MAARNWLTVYSMLSGITGAPARASPSWDFAKSWTSNATLVGGIVTAALSLSALPELTKHASKSGYSALVSLVVTVAPFIFTALRSGTVKKDATIQQDVVVYQGYLLPFFAFRRDHSLRRSGTAFGTVPSAERSVRWL
ncbi:hypothetical protein PMN64_30570 [Bradyrhizobium sp. UFLA01-814]|uniref:hypothetical protein n=1 Tax=Bradyrhizobium sp. UFLA01-814 TaxID=3023480 RepID=UPI00398B1CB5